MAAYCSNVASRIASFDFATSACNLLFGNVYPPGPSVPRRRLQDHLNNMEIYNDAQFLARYRFTKATVQELLSLLPLKETGDKRGLPLTPMLQLLVTLRFYAAGTFQSVTGDLVHVSQATVCRTVNQVTMLIAKKLFRKLVHFPEPSEYHGVKRDFYAITQFPGVTGCTDCTHKMQQCPWDSVVMTYQMFNIYSGTTRPRSGQGTLLRGPSVCGRDASHSWTCVCSTGLVAPVQSSLHVQPCTTWDVRGTSHYPLLHPHNQAPGCATFGGSSSCICHRLTQRTALWVHLSGGS
ncbi:hypothetical protein HPB47_006623 [Ixodes persulcatus]|uniref:Uncharacterized protein n=1 Tax=Ixodes persulcatus TaxID=34615 RepID=A0AC60P9S2_IXOPE|nr:hypothetical protein HPB47_006623 [Ixodes persulcatus]